MTGPTTGGPARIRLSRRVCAPALLCFLLLTGCGKQEGPGDRDSLLQNDSLSIFDHHVHVLSPRLVGRWRSLGVPFGKPDYAYSDIDSILKFNPADRMFLVSMAYLYGTPEFADSTEERDVREENDFVAALARKHPGRLLPFCAVHPLRNYAAGELERSRRESGVYGLKLHLDACGVDLTEPDHRRRVTELLGIASGKNMPVIVQLDDGSGSFDDEEVRVFIDSILTPSPPLELYIAHLGSSGGYTLETRTVLAAFAEAFPSGAGPGKHSLFFDLSAVGLTEPTEDLAALTPDDWVDLSDRLLEIGLERVVFGSDYPVFNTNAYVRALEDNLSLRREELIGIMGNGPPRSGRAGR